MSTPQFRIGDVVSFLEPSHDERQTGTIQDKHMHHMLDEYMYVIMKENGMSLVKLECQIDLVFMDLTELEQI